MLDEIPADEIHVASPSIRGRARVVSIGGYEVRSTSRDVLAAAGVRSGDRMSPERLEQLLAEVEHDVASARAMRLLGYRERSRVELRARLTEDGFPAQVVTDVIERMEQIGALDDARFAEAYIRTKVAAGWGRDRIVRGLTAAGLEPDRVAPRLEEEAPAAQELDRALAMLPADPPRDRRERERLVRRLVSRGFSYDVARTAIEQHSCVDNDSIRNRFES